ncbi:MAG: hypothetical protein M3336_17045, partial [Chloroflexota bacterium]|nr:hypothetical protein [Chloroflexota bacterium]
FKSNDGGSSWVGPTRVNNDPSETPANRDCGRTATEPACPQGVNTGNDQWWPWIAISDQGDLNITFKDRRLDTSSIAHEWPSSRQRAGNYLVWTWAAQCRVSQPDSRDCLAPGAALMPPPSGPIDPGPGPVPGNGPTYAGDFRNFKVSDVPSNFDYAFRAGIFAGDYESIAVSHGRGGQGAEPAEPQAEDLRADLDRGGANAGANATAFVLFTDARNGRSSRRQLGRNPACEQSDAFFDSFNARNGGSGGSSGQIGPFLVTPCPGDAGDRQRSRAEDD